MQSQSDGGKRIVKQSVILSYMECKNILTGLFDRVSGLRDERPSAGTKYRLMGLVADIAEVVQTLRDGVLQRVSQEAVVDADVDIDYAEMSELVMTMKLEEREGQDDEVREQVRLSNEGLSVLGSVLGQIDSQLERRHKDEEYERLYLAELKRYNTSGTSHRAKKNYEKWKDDECYGEPSADDLDGYRLCKLLKMFGKGVFQEKVAMNQRAKHFPGEVDFGQVDDEHPLKKTAYRHYAALRKMVDFKDGYLVVNAARVGHHFFVSRKEANAKANRTNFLKYMHKIDMAQQERRKLLEGEESQAFSGRSTSIRQEWNEELFHFVHPELDEAEALRIHNAVKRVVKLQGIQMICQYLSQLKQENKVLLPPNPQAAYAELVRLGMPSGEGFNEATFRKYYNKN